MFFKPYFQKSTDEIIGFDKAVKITGLSDNYIKSLICEISRETYNCHSLCSELNISLGIPSYIKEMLPKNTKFADESYAIDISERTKIFGMSRRAVIYALNTLIMLSESGEISKSIIYDVPDKDLRGYKIFIPGEDSTDEFYQTVDKIVYYKYNTLFIEVGGAMEYKLHPEINEKWVEFATKMKSESGLSDKIQHHTYGWPKNSIHADNGNGGFLSQEKIRELIEYCIEREIEVIPEVPLLSHSDYIVMSHPELNERKEDMYPDTYYPSNPKTYEIVFDILSEVIDVFKPKRINIGHDEYYTCSLCEECKKRKPSDIYAEDIIKIDEFLNKRGIETMMWGDKLLNHYDSTGYPLGGAENPEAGIPQIYDAIEKIPKNITIINWFWSIISEEEELTYRNHGLKMIYGNYSAMRHTDYRKRVNNGVSGGFVSNWGSLSPLYMQRNAQNYALLYTSLVFWDKDYTDANRAEFIKKVEKELYSSFNKRYKNKATITITHTTDFIKRKSFPFYDGFFIVPEEWDLGYYSVLYEDGSTCSLPVSFGYNISTDSIEELMKGQNDFSEGEADLYSEISGACIPIYGGSKMYYETKYENPHPNKKISKIEFIKTMDADFKIEIKSIEYGAAAK